MQWRVRLSDKYDEEKIIYNYAMILKVFSIERDNCTITFYNFFIIKIELYIV